MVATKRGRWFTRPSDWPRYWLFLLGVIYLCSHLFEAVEKRVT
ncbi:hypothetical protein [Haloarchaeobius sp. DYHT-AS-18]